MFVSGGTDLEEIKSKDLNGSQVLQIIEQCLAGRCKNESKSNTKMNGLLFEDFVECTSRLAFEIFPGVAPSQQAELVMLQLDQATNCLSAQGKIPHNRINRLPNSNIENKTNQAKGLSRSSSAVPTPRLMSATSLNKNSKKKPWQLRQRTGSLVDIDGEEAKGKAEVAQKALKKANSSRDEFLFRMEQDLSYRKEKMERLRGKSPSGHPTMQRRASSGSRYGREENASSISERKRASSTPEYALRKRSSSSSSSASSQASAMLRLHNSRKLYFEQNHARILKNETIDAATGRPFFKPNLETRQSKKTAQLRDRAASNSSRFEELYDKAIFSHFKHIQQRQNEHISTKQKADAPKVIDRSRHYFESRLTRDLSDAYLNNNNDSALAMTAQQCRKLLCHLLGCDIDTIERRHVIQAQLINNLMQFCLDPESHGAVTFARYMSFVKAVVSCDPYHTVKVVESAPSSLSSGPDAINDNGEETADVHSSNCSEEAEVYLTPDEYSRSSESCTSERESAKNAEQTPEHHSLFVQFRQLYLSQRCYSNQNFHKARKAQIEAHSFAPHINNRSRKIDSKRVVRDQQVRVSREEQLLKRASSREEALEQKRAVLQSRELDGCTFKPTISELPPSHFENKPPKKDSEASQEAEASPSVAFSRLHDNATLLQDQGGEDEDEEAKAESPRGVNISKAGQSKGPQGKSSSRDPYEIPSYMRSTLQSSNHMRPKIKHQNYLEDFAKAELRQTYETQKENIVDQWIDTTQTYSSFESTTSFTKRTQVELHCDVETTEEGRSPCQSDCTDSDLYTSRYPRATEEQDCSEDENDEIILFVDVETEAGVHRIEVYKNENPVKIAARFGAIHQISSQMERQLRQHLEHLLEHHSCC